ncbi:sugar ABC transporter permease [Veronia nyctiphanis]|uniref:Sugar ABC transporter permease n=1 Tax=Veronia nyctiphanis TaxID=1278244 RepID=A0A4Q0YPB4_9GAMM|nr:carbohydrate ABC transporter permease [Veronia nyctiphanis]RXJ72373.1 sugar ABC transporter permease [Veronia nyctiphanis]
MISSSPTREAIKHLTLFLGALIVLLPFYVMLSYSFKSPKEIETNTGGFFGAQAMMVDEHCVALGNPRKDCEQRPVVFNYTQAFKESPLLRYMLNGVIVTASIFFFQVLISVPAAYALSKLQWWGRDTVFQLVLFSLLIPIHAIALVIPWTISVFGIFLMRQFFKTVPDELLDAARLDGMSEFSIIWRVMLPTAIPALMAFGIFSVVAHWNDYFWPKIVITGDRELFTPPLGLREFKGDADGSAWGPMMATATVIVMPLIVAFLLAQKKFIEGITLSGFK